jgi:tetratricopeptide (TPR) repeat protein
MFLMNSKWKAKTLTLAVLSLGILFQPIAFAYDPDAFPGKGNEADFVRSAEMCNVAIKLQQQGKKTESLEILKKATHLYPYSAANHYNLGLNYSRLNDYRNALNCYKTAIKLAPDYARAHSNVSNVLFKLGDYKAAEQSALKATALNGKSPAAWLNLAQAEIALNKMKLAKQHLQLAKALPDASKYSSDLSELNSKLQNFKTAEN